MDSLNRNAEQGGVAANKVASDAKLIQFPPGAEDLPAIDENDYKGHYTRLCSVFSYFGRPFYARVPYYRNHLGHSHTGPIDRNLELKSQSRYFAF